MTFLMIFHDFANWSTVCAVPHIANAQTKISRLFWIIVFLTLLGLFMYELYLMISRFLSFPATIKTDIFYEEQNFPVVTVCNMNPYKYSVVKKGGDFDEIYKIMSTYQNGLQKGITTADAYGFKDVQDTPHILDNYARDALVLAAAKLTDTQKEPALYTYDDLISDCSFGGVMCNDTAFTKFVDPVYGACYSFNEDKSLKFTASRAGMRFGLKLLVTVSQETTAAVKDFLPTTMLAGARVAIHSRGAYPNLDGTGISVGVGFQTAIAMTYSKTLRAKKPYGKCIDTEGSSTNFYQSYDYTQETCFAGCRQRETWKRCSCANPRFSKSASYTWCTPVKADISCLQSLKGNQANKTAPNADLLQSCDCNPPCSEENFATTTSLSMFPAQNYYVATDSTKGPAPSCDGTTNPYAGKQSQCRDWYVNNALLLQVFFETLKYERYTEGPAYGLADVINDLGGHAGLWLGLSVISVVEVAGLVLLLCAYCCSRGKMKIRPSDAEMDEDHRIKDIKAVENELDDQEHYQKARRRRHEEENASSSEDDAEPSEDHEKNN